MTILSAVLMHPAIAIFVQVIMYLKCLLAVVSAKRVPGNCFQMMPFLLFLVVIFIIDIVQILCCTVNDIEENLLSKYIT